MELFLLDPKRFQKETFGAFSKKKKTFWKNTVKVILKKKNTNPRRNSWKNIRKKLVEEPQKEHVLLIPDPKSQINVRKNIRKNFVGISKKILDELPQKISEKTSEELLQKYRNEHLGQTQIQFLEGFQRDSLMVDLLLREVCHSGNFSGNCL